MTASRNLLDTLIAESPSLFEQDGRRVLVIAVDAAGMEFERAQMVEMAVRMMINDKQGGPHGEA